MINFYKDRDKRILIPELFSEIAMQWAHKIHEEGGGSANKRSQLRKFFDEVVRLNSLTKNNQKDWDNILPYVNMLIAKAAYAEGRQKVTGQFVDFIKGCIKEVHQKEDLDVFANFFEAFIGFYRQYGEN